MPVDSGRSFFSVYYHLSSVAEIKFTFNSNKTLYSPKRLPNGYGKADSKKLINLIQIIEQFAIRSLSLGYNINFKCFACDVMIESEAQPNNDPVRESKMAAVHRFVVLLECMQNDSLKYW